MKSIRPKLAAGWMVFLLFVGCSGVATAATQQITYTWTIPTTRADTQATPLPVSELAGYNIYYSINGGIEQKLAVALGTSTSKLLSLSLAPRLAGYVLVSAITAIDTEGQESARSAVVTTKLTVLNALPAPPGNIKMSVTCANGSCSLVVQ